MIFNSDQNRYSFLHWFEIRASWSICESFVWLVLAALELRVEWGVDILKLVWIFVPQQQSNLALLRAKQLFLILWTFTFRLLFIWIQITGLILSRLTLIDSAMKIENLTLSAFKHSDLDQGNRPTERCFVKFKEWIFWICCQSFALLST